ncbi:MAG TPA: proteasome accessory factor PafA2 family protein [Opitutaceae bacterium]
METEYGCLTATPGLAAKVVPRIRDWVFANDRFGLLDRHDRGWDEPAGNGGFLFNGGRLYVDMGHVEYCTAECATLHDLLVRDRAGDRLLLTGLRELGLAENVQFIRNNIDHRSGATFGCHENYALLRNAPFTDENLLSLLAFMTLRVLFTGSGRVGGGVPFQISQRADYIENDFFEWVQQSRAIINTRDEPLADPRRYRRLHLLHGDTHVLPSALFLKVGATRLVLDLLEADGMPPVALQEAVVSLRELSHQPEPPWRVTLASGNEGDAVELLSQFREACAQRFVGRDPETDAVLDLWRRVEAGLAAKLDSLVGLVDWVTKLHALNTFRESEKLAWDDPWLEAQDLEFHQVDPERSLGLALADLNGPWGAQLEAPEALTEPPADTRAARRSALMRRLVASGGRGVVDWHYVVEEGKEPTPLLDPYQSS